MRYSFELWLVIYYASLYRAASPSRRRDFRADIAIAEATRLHFRICADAHAFLSCRAASICASSPARAQPHGWFAQRIYRVFSRHESRPAMVRAKIERQADGVL